MVQLKKVAACVVTPRNAVLAFLALHFKSWPFYWHSASNIGAITMFLTDSRSQNVDANCTMLVLVQNLQLLQAGTRTCGTTRRKGQESVHGRVQEVLFRKCVQINLLAILDLV